MVDRTLLALAATLALSVKLGCPVVPPEPPPVPEASCEAVCAHWRDLGCHEAEPSPAGASCEQLCDAFERYWDLGCMASVESCEEIERCP
jgi:hypothetical protein